MTDVLERLARCPVVVAPMAGGSSTAGLVLAASAAGALGFLAAGYKAATAVLAEMDAVQAGPGAAPFGVNVFVPGPPTDCAALDGYLAELGPDADALGVAPGQPQWSDDDWDAKLAALLAHPPAVVSFTFGCPEPGVIAALRAAGSAVWVTVTTPDEAALAASRGADGLCVQGPEAGAHRGTFSAARDAGASGPPLRRLLAGVVAVTSLPLIAAGAIMIRQDVPAPAAERCGPVRHGLPALPGERGPPLHKAALADPGSPAPRSPGRSLAGPRAAWSTASCRHPDAPPATRRCTSPPGRRGRPPRPPTTPADEPVGGGGLPGSHRHTGRRDRAPLSGGAAPVRAPGTAQPGSAAAGSAMAKRSAHPGVRDDELATGRSRMRVAA
jgi:nitronate monooxygenase